MDNKKLSRVRNRYIILEYLRRTESSSPSQIATATGISLPTVTRILSSLVEERLVQYAGHEASTGGRPATVVRFIGDRQGLVSIYAHTTGIFGAVSDLSGNIVHEVSAAPLSNGEANMNLVLQMARQLCTTGQGHFERIRGVGVAVQAMVKQPSGEVVLTSSALDWRSAPLGAFLTKNLGLPVLVDSDHIYGAVGEWNYGAARHVDILVRLSVGPGASTGLVMNGEVFRGSSDAAGELKWFLDDPRLGGHRFPLLGDKTELRYGFGLPKEAFDRLEELAVSYEAGDFDPALLLEGNPDPSLDQIRQLMVYTTLAMSSAAAILNPTVVVMTGQISRGGRLVIDQLRSIMGGDVFQVPRIVHSDLGFRAVMLGAAKAVMDLTTLQPDTTIETAHDVLAAASH
ncbi:ROK family protein [Devosia sp. LjRoot3]|uniref:ROK family protein n=1 Tax=Devosia sp. LjRoot3 TaxID=3342319 RepID=UPI003ECE96D5